MGRLYDAVRTLPYDTCQFDDVIREEIAETDEVIEPANHCAADEYHGCTTCVRYYKMHGRVSHCTCDCHKDPKTRPEISAALSAQVS